MERSFKCRRTDDMESFNIKRDWSEIPGHLLANVLERLIVADDYVKFGAVCVSWRTVFAEELGMMMIKKKHRRLLPFLLIPPHKEEKDGNTKSRSLYNLSKRRVCDFEVQLPHSKCCRGSCFGWVINLEIDDSRHYSVQLHNPFLSNNHTIDLPSLDNIVIKMDERIAKYRWQPFCLSKAVLSANPTLAANYVVMAIMDFPCSRLAFFKSGNKDWIQIECDELISDVLYFNKTQQFYVVDDLGAVFAIDLQGEGEEGSTVHHPIPKLTQIAPSTQNTVVSQMYKSLGASKRYLVESLSGDLLQVVKFMGSKSLGRIKPGDWITRFEVFKLDMTTGGEWIHIDSLGDTILFLGENSSFCLSASDVPECKPNCIYFTEDFDWYKHSGIKYGPEHAAIFNLDDKTIQPHYPMESRRIYPLPIWIEPTIQIGNCP